MDFPSFTCVLLFDSTLKRHDEVTLERLATVTSLADSAEIRNFSVTHFDGNLDATTLLSTTSVQLPKVDVRR